jgi:hypothetical protein
MNKSGADEGALNMRRTIALLGAAAIAIPAAATYAAPTNTPPSSGDITPPHGTGQPGASCEELGNQPGNSTDNTGSAFADGGKAGSRYAGEQPGINDKNTASVSQYDQACAVNQSPQH